MSRRLGLSVSLLLCAYLSAARGGEVLSASVEHENGRFTIHSDIRIAVPAAEVRAILTAYENLPRVNSGIRSVQILARDGAERVRMRVDSGMCILWVCRDYTWVQEASILPSGDILTVIDPAESTFREGRVRYRILSDGNNARLVTDAVVAPDVWFPPVIGPWLIKRKLQTETLETAAGVERLATVRDNKD